MTDEEFRVHLRRELENPDTRRLVLELVTKELRRTASASMGSNAPHHQALEYLV